MDALKGRNMVLIQVLLLLLLLWLWRHVKPVLLIDPLPFFHPCNKTQDHTWQAMVTSMWGCHVILTFVDAVVEEWAWSGK
jgi:hypothetical protein